MNKFEQEVAQNRPRMALLELISIIQDLTARLEIIESKIIALETKSVAAAKSTSTKKAPAKKTAAKKDPDTDSE